MSQVSWCEICEIREIHEIYEIREICEICEIFEICEICEIREIYEIYGICEVITTRLQPICIHLGVGFLDALAALKTMFKIKWLIK